MMIPPISPSLVFLLVYGSVVSLYDFRHRRIPNRFILLGLAGGIFNLVWLFLSGVLSPGSFLILIGSSVLLGFSLYFIGVWPAGDGKFFITLSLFLPGILPVRESVALPLLLNSVVPYFFVIFFVILLRSGIRTVWSSLTKAFTPYRVFFSFIILGGIAHFVSKGLGFIGLNNLVLSLVMLFVFYELLVRLPVQYEVFLGVVFLVRLFIDRAQVFLLSFWVNLVLQVLVFVIFRFFALEISFFATSYEKRIEELVEGDLAAEGWLEHQGKLKRVKFIGMWPLESLSLKKKGFVHSLGRLSLEDITTLRALGGKHGVTSFWVHQAFPFAGVLFLGAILTIIFQGPVF